MDEATKIIYWLMVQYGAQFPDGSYYGQYFHAPTDALRYLARKGLFQIRTNEGRYVDGFLSHHSKLEGGDEKA